MGSKPRGSNHFQKLPSGNQPYLHKHVSLLGHNPGETQDHRKSFPLVLVSFPLLHRHNDQGNLKKKAFSGRLLIASEAEFTATVVGSMAAGREAWREEMRATF